MMAHSTAEFDHMVEKLMEEWNVPCLSLAIVHGEDIEAKVRGSTKILLQNRD